MKFVDSIWMLNKVLLIGTMKITDNRWKERVDIQGSIPKKIFLVNLHIRERSFFDFCYLFTPFSSPRLLPFPSLSEPDPLGSDKKSPG